MVFGIRAISIIAILAFLFSQLVHGYAVNLDERAVIPFRRQIAGSVCSAVSTGTTSLSTSIAIPTVKLPGLHIYADQPVA